MTFDPYKVQGVRPRSGADISTFILQTLSVLSLQTFSEFSLFSHGKSQGLGFQEQNLSITGRTAGNPCPSGYGLLAHQRDQNWLTRTPSFYDLKDGKGRSALTFLYKKGRTAKRLFAITEFKSLSICYKFLHLAYLPN